MIVDSKTENEPAQKTGGSIYLKAIDPAENKARFYAMYIINDLWGGYSLVREYGRIGQPGRVLMNWHPKKNDATNSMNKISRLKQKRGYQ